MEVGLMWLDVSQLPLTTKIKTAVEYYFKKYGREPNMVVVNHKALFEEVEIEGMKVISEKYILPKQIWIGVEE